MDFQLTKAKRKAPRVRTVCKRCLSYILEGEPTHWRTSTPLGLVHKECA